MPPRVSENCPLVLRCLSGHQGRYDEAEEVQKLLAVRQRMDAAEQKAIIKARRERQARRLLTAQEAERHSLESRVERLVSYHNRQNAEAIDVLRRKYLGQRKSLIHIQGEEAQAVLHSGSTTNSAAGCVRLYNISPYSRVCAILTLPLVL